MNRPVLALAALVLVGALPGCGGDVRASDPGPAPEETAATTATTAPSTPAGPVDRSCGREVAFDGGSGLRLTSHLPARVAAPGSPSAALTPAAGTVEVTADRPVRGVGAPGAEVLVTRDGRLVSLPTAQDALAVRVRIAPGSPRTLDAALSLVSCTDGRPLAAGRYEVWARVAVTTDDGTTVDGVGGPWPLQVG